MWVSSVQPAPPYLVHRPEQALKVLADAGLRGIWWQAIHLHAVVVDGHGLHVHHVPHHFLAVGLRV